jgi:hypothetical protein
MKKSAVTQELANIYPPWSKTRADQQSVGFQMLNTMAVPMERMEKALKTMGANQHLVTANLDEIDLTYRVTLPVTFSFDEDTTDPLHQAYSVPTVSGYLNGTWYDVSVAADNDIQSFWYDSSASRASLETTVSGVDHDLVSLTASGISVSGLWEHHLGGGAVWVETVGGTVYLSIEDNDLSRGRVILRGVNRQGLDDQDIIIFPWDMQQKSIKEWTKLTKVEAYDMEDNVEIFVTSANFNHEDYLSPWNLRFSEHRNKIDEFWALGVTASGTSLDRVGYITDEWQQLVLGFVDKEPKVRWDLLDSNGQTVSGVDIALQPFSDNVWMVTDDGTLYCYEAGESMVENVSLLKGRTAGTHVQIDVEEREVLLDDDITFTPWHARPLKEVVRYRLWYQTPSGDRYGLLDGSQVAFTSDFWVVGRQLQRTVSDTVTITAEGRGDYLLVLEVVYLDDTTDTEKVLVSVNYKTPKTTIDISSLVPEAIEGIDFDADQRLWVKTADKYYQINLHTDIMLVDYTRKIIYFKEPYTQVVVETSD